MATNRKKPSPLPFAMMDKMHVLMPGLFKSLKKGEDNKERVYHAYDYGHYLVEVKSWEQLTVFDLTLLQAVVSLAAPSRLTLNVSPKGEVGQTLRKLLDLRHDATEENGLVVETSARRLASEMGMKYAGHFMDRVEKSVDRFMTTAFFIRDTKAKKRFGFNLLSYTYASNKDDKLIIGLNPFLAAAIFGGSFALISMDECRKMKSDGGKLLHTRLSSYIDPGKTRVVRYDTLCRYVWPDVPTPATARQQMRRIKKIVDELIAAEWTVEHKDSEKVSLTRPLRRYRQPPVQMSLLEL